ncbi:condensation domain-containing protein [Streptomyces sp. NPDC002701]|uniref:condensation domain-containing protein n=1 Tax=unclassified Streptomyces TaxID=2593676 RepID=UPI0036A0F329
MTTDHGSPPPPGRETTVVLDLAPAPHDEPALEVHGPLEGSRLEAVLDEVAVRHPDAFARPHRIDHAGPAHHTLRLAAGAPGATVPWGLLADLLTHPAPRARTAQALSPTPLQRELLADADAHCGRHVERLAWAWHGPLDPDRFRAAWQSVVDHESVLRSAFGDGAEPLLLVHDDVTADVACLPDGTLAWDDLVEHDVRRGLDPRLPPGLRATVLGGAATAPGEDTHSRVLLTYHHALLDDWSARLLVREFYRAYLAGGRLPGGERRPDIRDYIRWVHRQDTAPARDYWSRPTHRADALSPVPLTDAGAPVAGHTQVRLDAARTERLTAWAARWGSSESGVLQALWAVLLYRAGGAEGPARIRFGVSATGRGILFEGAERLPAALRTPLPLSVRVDPRSTVATLLTEIRDRVLDMASYEWVSPGQIRDWSPPPESAVPDGSLLVFEGRPRPADDQSGELAAQGVRVEGPEPLGARTAFPVSLVVRHDDAGLLLSASYDRVPHTDATEVLTDSVSLLTEVPYLAADTVTVADLLRLLARTTATAAPAAAPRAAAPGTPADLPLVPLRPATEPGAGVVCLVQAPGTPRARYGGLAGAYRGPESVVLLCSAPDGDSAGHTALRRLGGTGRLLVLATFSGGGTAACEAARLVAADGGRPPFVVLTGATTPDDAFARTLESTATRARPPGATGPPSS